MDSSKRDLPANSKSNLTPTAGASCGSKVDVQVVEHVSKLGQVAKVVSLEDYQALQKSLASAEQSIAILRNERMDLLNRLDEVRDWISSHCGCDECAKVLGLLPAVPGCSATATE